MDVSFARKADCPTSPLNAPVCLVDRSVVYQPDRLVLVSKGIYRGDLVRMDMRLT